MAASRAYESSPALAPRRRRRPTAGADEPGRPAQVLQVLAACGVVGEHLDELAIRARVLSTCEQGLRCCRRVRGAHPYILGQEELTVHPTTDYQRKVAGTQLRFYRSHYEATRRSTEVYAQRYASRSVAEASYGVMLAAIALTTYGMPFVVDCSGCPEGVAASYKEGRITLSSGVLTAAMASPLSREVRRTLMHEMVNEATAILKRKEA